MPMRIATAAASVQLIFGTGRGTPPPGRLSRPKASATETGSSHHPPQDQLGDDPQGVPGTLPLGRCLSRVPDCHRHLAVMQPVSLDLVEDLRCVGHAILPDAEALRGVAREGPETVMG